LCSISLKDFLNSIFILPLAFRRIEGLIYVNKCENIMHLTVSHITAEHVIYVSNAYVIADFCCV